jgi:hypothetical protein
MTARPWHLGPWDLELDLAKVDEQWGPIRRILEDRSLFDRADPTVSAWSCGQHAGHVVLIATSIARQIEESLRHPDQDSEEQTSAIAHHILSTGTIRRGVAKSPPEALPQTRTRDDFLALLPSTIETWNRIRARPAEVSACHARLPHFALGHLSSGEWVRFCAVHTAHHLRVVVDIAGEPALTTQRGTDRA